MPLVVPKDKQSEFNKHVKKSLELLTSGVTQKLGEFKNLQPDTIVDAYNRPIQAPVTRDLTPLEQSFYQAQPVGEISDITEQPIKENLATPQEQPSVLSNFVNQANARFGGDMVSMTPYEQAVSDVVGSEIDSLRKPDGEIYMNAGELFSQPVDYNKFKAIGFVDQDGNATPEGELFFNLKESGMFNEDATITERGQAYSIPESEIGDNKKAFRILWDDGVIRPESTWDEKVEGVTEFGGNVIRGAFDMYRLGQKITSPTGIYDIIKRNVSGQKTIAEQQVSSLAALEQTAKNFQQAGGWGDILQGLAGIALYQGIDAVNQTQLTKELVDAADENLYAARQRQWKANQNIQDLEVGQIAESVFGLDGAVKMAEDAKQTLGEEKFKRTYAGVSAVTEIALDPSAAIPATKAFTIAKSAPIASRAIIGAQKILGETAQVDMAIAKAAEVVETGNSFLRKEALSVDLAQKLSKDISSRAVGNPELLARAKQASDTAQRITASANDIRAAMPNAVKTLDDLTVKRNSLAARIPEAYAQKVLQTAELGRKIRSMPARTISSMLERTGEVLTKVDDSVTTYLKDRGLDQAYNAALGASGVVGLAGNPIVGAIGVAGATLKAGKFLTEYGKILRYVGKEMENARGQIPFWKRVASHTAPGSLGRGLAHTFNIFELGGATSDIIRRTGRGMVAAYPSDLFFEWLSDGGDMRPETMTQAAAESYVIGGSFAAGGGAFMGTNKRMKEISIGDEINFRQGLTDTRQKALFESLPPSVRRSISTYSMANPTLNYNFNDTGTSGYDPNTNTATINIGSTNPLKALVAHETLHHTLIKNNMEGGIAALFLGDTQTNSVGGLLRSKDGTLDPEFERFSNRYYDRLRASGMSDSQINATYPLDKVAVEYFIEQHADQYAAMAESGELGALSARGEVRKKLGSVLETILPKIPVLRDLHIKSGGMMDANGAWVTGNGILGADGIKQNPVAKKMFREMNRRSAGVMPGQFEPLMSDKEGSGAPLVFDPTNPIDIELMHPLVKVDEQGKPILQNGRPIALDRSVDIDRAVAGLSVVEALRQKRETNYVPEKGEAHVDDEGTFQPGWIPEDVLTQMFAKHQFNAEQKRMIRQTNKLIKQGAGQRMVMINFPATTRNKANKVVYKTQGATIRDTVPVAMNISKDGNILFGLMSVTKLNENIKKRSQSKRGKKLYGGNVDLILRDTQAMMDFHKKGEDSINYFAEKYGAVEADQRKKFINTMFGLLNKKEQAVLNPMLLEDGVKSADNVYRTYRADRVSKAIPMAPEEYQAMPFSYEAVSQVRMPEARQMPEQAQTKNNQERIAFDQNQPKQGPANGNQPTTIQTQPSGASVSGSEATGAGLRQQGGLSRGTEQLQSQGSAGDQSIPLVGLPATVTVPGIGKYTFGPNETARGIAEEYARSAGLDYNPPKTYAKVDAERAKRIADEYEKMSHNPNDPKVKESYDAMIKETLDQWEAIKKTGLKVEPIPAGSPDPYAASPRLALIDVKDNNHLWFFPTSSGFGGTESAGVDISGNPLMKPTGEVLNGHPMLANDVFRIVHDYFGHIKEGVGFRADGEENAWRSHSAMYSDKARPAMTAETRGQNSWVNFGPFAEFNKTATGADTQYAPQKTGLLPDWVMKEGASDARFMPEQLDADYMKAVESGDVEEQQKMVDKAAKAAGYEPKPWYHGSQSKNITVFNRLFNRENYDKKASEPVGIWFTESGNAASILYGNNVTSAYLKLQNPIVFKDKASLDDAVKKAGGYEKFRKSNSENDGIVLPTVRVVFEPNQIKSADPITRDDSGKVIPLSKRFDIGSKDIRFMPEATDVSPEELNPVANMQEAQGLWADGKRLFAMNEMEETVTPITSKAMLEAYTADQIGWMEPAAQSDIRFMPEGSSKDINAGVKEPVGSLGDLRKNVEIPKTQLPSDVSSVPKYVARETKDGDWKVMDGASRIKRGNFQTPLPNAQIKKTKEFSTPKQDIISTASESRQIVTSNKTSIDAKQQAASKVNDAIDKINNAVTDADNNPEKFVDVKGYAEIMKNAGVTGDILIPPSSLRTMLYKPDDFVSLLDGGYHGDKTVAGIRDAAMSGLDAVVEMRQLIGNQPPDLVTALHHLWGTLSKQLPPLQQEALWMRMIVNKDVMEQIGRSINGTFNLSPDQWKQIVLKARADTKGTYGKLGENATSNANSFYLMLAKHNGKWNEVSNVYATNDAVDMRYKFNTLGHGATGIKNKVQSFIGLTFGIKGNVLDRWRFVDMFLDDAMKITGAKTTREYFKYEGKAKNVPVDKIGIYKNYGTIENGSPLFSLALYSAMDRVSQRAIDASPALQKILGNHADPGGLHWLSWNAIKNEAVGHSSLDITKNFIKKYKKEDNFNNLTVDNFVDFVNNTEAFVEGTSGAGDEITRLTLKNGVFNYSKR